MLFRRETTVLYFSPRLPKDMRWRHRRFILWPLLMYRVVAPEVRERRVSVLQRAVLGMCRAGTVNVEKIGARLHLHPDLAGVIVVELQRRGLVGSNGLPTADGQALLEEETLESRAMVTGHVFQDPWSGELWPRFIERLDYAELQPGADGFPDLVLGSKGRPRRERAFMVLPGELAVPPPPGPGEIVRATRRHRAAVRNAETYEAADEDDTAAGLSGVALDRVELIDDRPTPVYVTTFVYLPEGDDSEWHVSDPFGLGVSAKLRGAIERLRRTSDPLRALFESMIGGSLDQQLAAQAQFANDLRTAAIAKIERGLTCDARDLPEYEHLVAMESARLEAELLGASCPEYKLREVLGGARRALEATFFALFDRHPPHGVWRSVYDGRGPATDEEWCRGVYEASATSVGFRTPLPRALAYVRPNHVKAACYPDGRWHLRGAIIAAVLGAARERDHPMRRAAARDPGLLHRLDDILGVAGGAVHASAERFTYPAIEPVVMDVLGVVGLLSGLGVASS